MPVIDIKPSFGAIQRNVGTIAPGVAYNSLLAYNSSQVYGGFAGGIGGQPSNVAVLNNNPENYKVFNALPNL